MAVSLLHLLHDAVQRFPERRAVADCAGASLSYAQLDESSARLAGELRVRRGDRVGLLMPKSVDAVVAAWAIMRAGCAYVPLDVTAPPARAAMIARDCGMAALMAPAEFSDAVAVLQQAVPTMQWIQTDGERRAAGSGPLHPLSPSAVNVRDLAYILYTSGSTGVPKGVMVTHGAALGFIEWGMETFNITCDDVLSNHAPFHFDLSTFDLYCAAAAGASVVVLDEETVRFPMKSAQIMERERISVWYSVPGALRSMIRIGRLRDRNLSALRVVLFAGEVYPVAELHVLQETLPASVRLCNLYGPTETNVCTWWEVPPAGTWDYEQPPIGIDCSSCQGVIVDERMQPVADGETGELLVRGATLMSGYWGDRERTDRGFVANFLQPHLGDRFWRTGDIVSRDAAGLYRFHGRRDHMVKVRGYRIELGEVESALQRLGQVQDAAVVAIERRGAGGGAGETELMAFIVGRDEDRAADPAAALHDALAQSLPKYMLPSQLRWIDALPRTSNGKVDRQKLSQLAAGAAAS
jgi:amino acid adenylation domain-containing protein